MLVYFREKKKDIDSCTVKSILVNILSTMEY